MVSNSTNSKVLLYSLFQLYHLMHGMHINFICFFVSFKTSWQLFITFCLQSILLAATVKSEKVKEQDQNFLSHTLKFLINNGADISVILSPKEKKSIYKIFIHYKRKMAALSRIMERHIILALAVSLLFEWKHFLPVKTL